MKKLSLHQLHHEPMKQHKLSQSSCDNDNPEVTLFL